MLPPFLPPLLAAKTARIAAASRLRAVEAALRARLATMEAP